MSTDLFTKQELEIMTQALGPTRMNARLQELEQLETDWDAPGWQDEAPTLPEIPNNMLLEICRLDQRKETVRYMHAVNVKTIVDERMIAEACAAVDAMRG